MSNDIICFCNNVSRTDLMCAIDRGLHSYDQLSLFVKVADVCGSCQGEIKEAIETYKPKANPFLKIVKID